MQDSESKGRESIHSDNEHKNYWEMSDAERQDFLRQSYETRNPDDPYSTSRDFYHRELEIDSIAKYIGIEGSILDLGCGNGYTLLSLAKNIENREMLGIDFAQNLINGAHGLKEKMSAEIKSSPEFICEDAVKFLKEADDNSWSNIITERFIQNLPSRDAQKSVLGDIHRVLKPGGRLLMCEGEKDGFYELNDLRENLGLDNIPETSGANISSLRIDHEETYRLLKEELGFDSVEKIGYSMYFIISKVLHPLFVAPEGPRFDSKLNKIAMEIQKNIPYDPGYGSMVLWVAEKRG